ncbi:ABC transporter substrate-binding protein [Paenalcaligenes niemegkensis]|uniref:ABC transporter substrate-binding protein n=1 Tax=Paenalcaligenes niemegkensis TaxID=2895469 RepID=UPI001EE87691|nr:ABC transporter substrate-binding protein [Paenalcaligenes niemegkensis]MCQ9617877.1 ABC transporter substrate-binding protein [Paenalcaligenes niemegkensis]
MTKFRIAATGHSVNYLPEYVAAEQGFFAEENLQVDAIVPDPWDLVLTEIRGSNSHAALGGIWVPAMFHNRGKKLTSFAKISARCPLVIVGRQPEELAFSALRGTTILVAGSNGASPGLFLELLLSENGVDKADVNFVQNLSGSMLAELFVGGLGDYILVDPVTATRITTLTQAHIVSPLAKTGGPVPWSVYYSEEGTAGDQIDTQIRFVRALNRGIQWILKNPTDTLRPLLSRLFPRLDVDHAIELVENFKQWGMWDTARIEKGSYDRWQRGLAQGHLIDAPLDYHELVNEQVANEAEKVATRR